MAVTEETKQTIFKRIKAAMEKSTPPLVHKKGTGLGYELIGNTPTTYGYKKEIVPGMYFASTLIRKDSVVLYFFPCYMNEAEYKPLAPTTWKTLKGKTCFHFKKETDVNEKELEAIFKKGIAYYKKQGWIK
jgi:hypothetical protein